MYDCCRNAARDAFSEAAEIATRTADALDASISPENPDDANGSLSYAASIARTIAGALIGKVNTYQNTECTNCDPGEAEYGRFRIDVGGRVVCSVCGKDFKSR